MKKIIALASLATASLTAMANPFQLSSPDLASGGKIGQSFAYNGFGCTGKNLSPALSWKNAPAGTKSFAITVHDPDAVTGGGGFWHWVVVNIPASTQSLAENAGNSNSTTLPAGALQIPTDFGVAGWGGPCPPAGDKPHRYNFTVYALKVDKLELPPTATAGLTGFMINANALAKTSFTSTYQR
ncbi:MAG: YbhB/YbcL family Raf kinase inhibitor-like protein [Rubrivivax sp.]|nr:MAG: YbhB/YbcL family Raf kinase inhibitor-like protein [Rubrivivax sp.]